MRIRAIVQLLLYIDARIQRRFDTVIHFVMRALGVTKGFIRYTMWGVIICRFIFGGALSIAAGEPWGAFFNICMAIVCGLAQYTEKYIDDRSDQAEKMSPMDMGRNGWKLFWWLILITGVLLDLLDINDAERRFDQMHQLLVHISGVFWLGMEYLRSTPPRPPAKKTQKRSVFFTATASDRA